jgi:hypothetical protein
MPLHEVVPLRGAHVHCCWHITACSSDKVVYWVWVWRIRFTCETSTCRGPRGMTALWQHMQRQLHSIPTFSVQHRSLNTVLRRIP